MSPCTRAETAALLEYNMPRRCDTIPVDDTYSEKSVDVAGAAAARAALSSSLCSEGLAFFTPVASQCAHQATNAVVKAITTAPQTMQPTPHFTLPFCFPPCVLRLLT